MVLQDWGASASPSQPITPHDASTYGVTVDVRPGGIATDPLAQASASFTLTVADAPAPTGLHQVSSTRTAVTVGWTSPALSTITTFQAVIQIDPSDPNSWDTVVLHSSDAGFSSRTATFSALTPGTSYTVLVAACDAAGSCSWSAPLTVSTAGNPPGPHPPPCGPRTCM
jgi:hypothetical protein